jgi:ketosteroid isomerase-like protein
MSEQANVQVVKDAYAAFLRGDVQGILDRVSNDVEWVAADVEPVAGTYRGKAEVAQFFQRVNETAEYPLFEPREFIAQGDRVVTLGRYRGISRNTGREFDCEWAMVFTLTDGKVSRFQEFTDTAKVVVALAGSASAANA